MRSRFARSWDGYSASVRRTWMTAAAPVLHTCLIMTQGATCSIDNVHPVALSTVALAGTKLLSCDDAKVLQCNAQRPACQMWASAAVCLAPDAPGSCLRFCSMHGESCAWVRCDASDPRRPEAFWLRGSDVLNSGFADVVTRAAPRVLLSQCVQEQSRSELQKHLSRGIMTSLGASVGYCSPSNCFRAPAPACLTLSSCKLGAVVQTLVSICQTWRCARQSGHAVRRPSLRTV